METFLGLDYPTWWFLVVGGLFSGYAILDGFDFGAGAWHLFLKKENSRRIALNAVGLFGDTPGRSIEATRAEVRCPDPTANTYLAFAAMLAAGLDGIEKGLKLADPVEESLFDMDAATVKKRNITEMPGSLGEAITALEQDEVIADALGDHVYTRYLEAKREEWASYKQQITQWELDRYLEAY